MSEIKGTLPKALKKLVGQTDIKSRNIVMRQPTAIEYLEAQAKIGIGQFVHIADLDGHLVRDAHPAVVDCLFRHACLLNDGQFSACVRDTLRIATC